MANYELPEEYKKLLAEREEIEKVWKIQNRRRIIRKTGIITACLAAIISYGAYTHVSSSQRDVEERRLDSIVSMKFNEDYAPLCMGGPFSDPAASRISEIQAAYMAGRVVKAPQYASVDEVVTAAEKGFAIRQGLKDMSIIR